MSTNDHILSTFNTALQELKETTLTMASGTQRNLQNAISGLLQRDKQLCNQAIADDDDEDRLEIEIDRLGMAAIIRFRPVAGDLRMVIGTMKTATNLERISDQAVSIAKRARKMVKQDELPDTTRVEGLYQVAASMLADAVTAYADGNSERLPRPRLHLPLARTRRQPRHQHRRRRHLRRNIHRHPPRRRTPRRTHQPEKTGLTT